MAYVTPPLRASGDIITAAHWNQDVRDNFINFETHAHTGTTSQGAATLGPLTYIDSTDAAVPAAPGAGRTRWYSASGAPRFRAGAAGADTPLVPAGTAWRTWYANGSGEPTQLAISADDRILTSFGTASAPAWSEPPARRWAHHLMNLGK